ncbi:alpha/beta fold hydrolase [Kineosporia sp. R_H_3]|uniref:alpha/beta fold hydrolase n=1 Tax=Kineosporia sp. R_H_3 TaxID=1961848 RepID=UPI0018EA1028|nr:alpha/beta fold hydrolase [Kineosporia sp. R_H_3]
MRRRTIGITAATAAVLVAVAGALVATSGDATAGVREQTYRVDGVPEPGDAAPVTLDVSVFTPPADGEGSGRRYPAVLLAHGFGGSKADLADDARTLAGHGYVAVTYTARGFGASGGRIHLDAPDFEVADAQKILDALATRPDVLLDAPGDPRVGVAGGSYGGALSILLAGLDRRVDAIAPQITWNDLRQALFPQFAVDAAGGQATPAAVTPVAPAGVFKRAWAGVFFSPSGSGLSGGAAGLLPGAAPSGAAAPAATDDGPTAVLAANACGRFAADLCALYSEAARTGRPTTAMLDLLWRSSPARVTKDVTAPTLLVQGQADSLFPLSEGDANARAIAATGTPLKVVWEAGGHDGGVDESQRLRDLTLAWFDRYVKKDGSAPDTRFEVTVPDAVVSSIDSNPAPQVRIAPAEPGVTAAGPVPVVRLPLTGGPQVVQAPPGGSPAALTALPGVGGALTGALGSVGAGSALSALPGQVAAFETAPVERAGTVVGGGRIALRVTTAAPDATLFVGLYDVAPGGAATLPRGLVSPVRLELRAAGERGPEPTSTSRDVTVALPAVVTDLAVGHRLRVVVSTTDQGYALPADGRAYEVALAGDSTLTVPVLDAEVVGGGLRPLLPWALGLVGLMAAAVLVVTVGVRRGRRDTGPDPDLAEVPLAVRDLGKAYGDGFRAVSDLSFTVEQGRVLGLLGPNGAGKTTTLRMLMGLIAPTEGEIRVFGEPIRFGAPVLSRVGAFVEGPGFLPHLSGLENLHLYWAATGRPAEDARFDEALEVAGLGNDVQRRVRTYSQGMRQRLAIAQAMLGLPDLLVLDEPTNGLDPPQIREMREVLGRYAATGRTVVVSSHLLAEVEQTCSHVVVMHQGRLVFEGTVADLVGSATVVVVDVDDPQRAARVAASVEGAQDVGTTPTGIVLRLVGTPRGALVAALVAAGLQVERVAPQRGLEEAFLALVGES